MSVLNNIRSRYLSAFVVVCTLVAAQSQIAKEYQLKAVILFNFSRFVERPATSFASPEAPFVIGILGDDPFKTYLEEVVRGEKVEAHPIVVKHFRQISEVKVCHILFVSHEQNKKMAQIITALRGTNTLVVGDSPDFIADGGMVRLFAENSKIRLQINLDAAREENLTISSKLLRLADIVSNKSN